MLVLALARPTVASSFTDSSLFFVSSDGKRCVHQNYIVLVCPDLHSRGGVKVGGVHLDAAIHKRTSMRPWILLDSTLLLNPASIRLEAAVDVWRTPCG
jgi:hypothetical protein